MRTCVLVHVVFILQLVNHALFRVASATVIHECAACACVSAVKLLVSGTVPLVPIQICYS